MAPFSAGWHLRRSIARAGTVSLAGTIATLTRAIVVIPIIAIEIVIVVYVDVAVPPIAIAPVIAPIGTPCNASAKRQSHSRVPARIIIGIVRISRRTIHNCRIVRRNINYLRIGVLDHYDLLTAFHRLRLHSLLCAGLQGSFALGFGTHALDCVHYVGLLG
jgi:hypothetical protein